jgi:hypothetical protein
MLQNNILKIRSFGWLVSLILISFSARSQQSGRMETDRPDQTESFYITKKGYLQGEIGFNNERYLGSRVVVHPTALWKAGLHEKFELRVITELNTVKPLLMSPSFPENASGLLPVQIGGKIALCKENKLIPATSLIFHTGIPSLGSKNFRTPRWSPNFRFVMQHTLGEQTALGYNLGAEWNGFSNQATWIYTIAPGMNIGKRWYGYVEAFGSIVRGEKPAHAVDGGVAYYVNDDIKLDVSAGVGFSEQAIDNYIAVGLSFRVAAFTKR